MIASKQLLYSNACLQHKAKYLLRQNFDRVEGITAESLNDHYSQISIDRDYTPPALKQTVLYPNNDFISEWRVFTARCYASAVLAMALCPSVCPSVTSRCSTKTAKRRITQTTPHDSPGNLVFWCQRSPRNSTGVTPYEGAE